MKVKIYLLWKEKHKNRNGKIIRIEKKNKAFLDSEES